MFITVVYKLLILNYSIIKSSLIDELLSHVSFSYHREQAVA